MKLLTKIGTKNFIRPDLLYDTSEAATTIVTKMHTAIVLKSYLLTALEVLVIGVLDPGVDSTGEAIGAALGMDSQPFTFVASPVKPSGHVHIAPRVPLTQVASGNKHGFGSEQ